MLGVEALSGVLGIGMKPTDSTAGFRRYLQRLGGLGVAVLLVAPGSKLPDDVRTDVARKKDQRTWEKVRAAVRPHGLHLPEEAPAGLHLATRDTKLLSTRVAAYRKKYGEDQPVNIGIEAARSGLLLVDVDTVAELQAFRATWLHHASIDPANNYPLDSIAGVGPTVRSPGKQNPDGTWAHRGGGHWYFRVPEGWKLHLPLSDAVKAALEEVDVLPGSDLYETVELIAEKSVGQLTVSGGDVPTTFDGVDPGGSGFVVPNHTVHTAGWTVFWRNHYVLAPPSVRAEGEYEARNDCLPAPTWLTGMILDEIRRSNKIAEERAKKNAERAQREAKRNAREAAESAVPVPMPGEEPTPQPGPSGAADGAGSPYGPPTAPQAQPAPAGKPSGSKTYINVLDWVKTHPREIGDTTVDADDSAVVYTGIDLEHGSDAAKQSAKDVALKKLREQEAAGIVNDIADGDDGEENLYDEFAFDDALVEWYRATTWDDVLVPFGWMRSGTDKCGCEVWARPGNDRSSDKSATAHIPGCTDGHYHGSEDPPIHFWTTNPGPEIAAMISDRGSRGTLSKLQVYTALRHGGDFSAAAKETGMPVWRIKSEWGASRLWSRNLAPASTNPYDKWLEGVLFETSPILSHILQRAREAGISPWSALMIAVTTAAYYIPPNVKIPAIIGKPASLNQIVAVVAASGGGKGISFGKDIIQFTDTEEMFYGNPIPAPIRRSVGSGEAISALYVRWEVIGGDDAPAEENAAPASTNGHPRTSRNGHDIIDTAGGDESGRTGNRRLVQYQKSNWIDFAEVDKVVSIRDRKGSTLDPELRSLWSGENLGSVTKTNSMHVPEHVYRGIVTMSVQPRRAAGLFSDDAGGLLQRIVWCSANDPHILDPKDIVDPAHRGAPMIIDLPRFPRVEESAFDIDVRVADEVKAAHVFLQRATDPTLENPPELDPLDTHRNLCRLKLAVAAAVLHGRTRVEYDDWLWAGYLMQHSDALREQVRRSISMENSKSLRAAAVAEARRMTIIETTREEEWSKREEEAYTSSLDWLMKWSVSNPGKDFFRGALTAGSGKGTLRRDKAGEIVDRMVDERILDHRQDAQGNFLYSRGNPVYVVNLDVLSARTGTSQPGAPAPTINIPGGPL